MGYETAEQGVHRLSLEDRGQLRVSGVSDVESFDEQTVVLHTVRGTLIGPWPGPTYADALTGGWSNLH